MQTRAGTAFFMAPEVITRNYSKACDMWSAGVILYIMLCGYPPFYGETDEEILEAILEGIYDFDDEVWDEVSQEAKDLICKLLVEEKQRLTPSEVLHDPWIKKFIQKENDFKISSKHFDRLKQFEKSSKLKKAALSFLAS